MGTGRARAVGGVRVLREPHPVRPPRTSRGDRWRSLLRRDRYGPASAVRPSGGLPRAGDARRSPPQAQRAPAPAQRLRRHPLLLLGRTSDHGAAGHRPDVARGLEAAAPRSRRALPHRSRAAVTAASHVGVLICGELEGGVVREIETDYLVVGAGASGMAFVDALLAGSDADVVIADRRHGPGGHWLDAYPFVRLHQPSANYGVNSRTLGNDRIDETGPNAGFYERSTAAEICDYFARVLDGFNSTGRVRFLGMSDYRGPDQGGHHLTSLLTGEDTVVKVRRKLVDATYVESSIPSRHRRPFTVDPDVRVIPPNDLVDLGEPATGFTVLGAGKTAMDTCNWLLDAGVDPDAIQWFRPRDPWLFNRVFMQPLELVGAYMHLQACWVEAAAEAVDATEFAQRLEDHDIFVRLDPATEPRTFRGATISVGQLE